MISALAKKISVAEFLIFMPGYQQGQEYLYYILESEKPTLLKPGMNLGVDTRVLTQVRSLQGF
jgi:hypothetical protein